MNVLFLFESVLPEQFHTQTTSPGELRVIAAQPNVEMVWALGPSGKGFYDVPVAKYSRSWMEQKIVIKRFAWPVNILSYYVTWLGLLVHGWRICRKQKIKVIHAESPHISGIAAVILGKMCGAKVIVEYRTNYREILCFRYGRVVGELFYKGFYVVSWLTFKAADLVAANSRTATEDVKKEYRLGQTGFYNPGVRLPVIFKHTLSPFFRVGFIGRLYPDKGVMEFIKLAHLLAPFSRKNKIKFFIAGDGPEMKKVKEFIRVEKLDDILELWGTVDRWKFFKQIDLIVNTTKVKAALEMTIAEASAAGVPVLAYGDERYPETVWRNKTGFVIETGNVEELGTLIEMIRSKPRLYQNMHGNAKKFARRYQFEQQVSQLRLIYTSL